MIVSRRAFQTAVARATSAAASGAVRAAATASWAMPTWQTTLVNPTRLMSRRICAGPPTQPTRHPIMRSSFDAAPTVIVRPANAGVTEILTLIDGAVEVGDIGATVELRGGESHAFAGDRAHLYRGIADRSTAILAMRYPAPKT